MSPARCHKRRFGRNILIAMLLSGMLLATSASAATYDMDGDSNLTAFDVVLKKREAMEAPDSSALIEMYMIDSHLMGYTSLGLNDDPPPQWLLEPKGTVHSGQATYYDGGITSGHASLAPVPDGIYVAAINRTDYNGSMLAGGYLRVLAENGNTIDVYVTDSSGQSQGHLDLNTNAFEQIAALSVGRLNITWTIIPYPTDEGMHYKFSPDSSSSWFSMQIRYHVYPIYSVEILQSDGTYKKLTRRSDNYFTCSGAGKGPFTFRVTDIYGQVVVEENVPLCAGDSYLGTGNFPA